MKSLLRKLTPPAVLRAYHRCLAILADWWYGHPSRQMIVVGVTGTSGKSTVVEMLDAILKAAGHRVGIVSTIRFQVGDQGRLNETKMTMVGRFQLQRWLKRMADAGCRYALVETSSQGILQSRHLGIRYDVCALTNLYPEHLDAHGGFENYWRAKRQLFSHLERLPPKVLGGRTVPKAVMVNLDAPHAADFLAVKVPHRHGFSVSAAVAPPGAAFVRGQVVRDGGRFGLRVDDATAWLKLPGEHNAGNALCAFAVARALGVAPADITRGLAAVETVPGRIEFVRAGQPFTVVVDYAFEPVAMRKLYDVVERLPHRRVIQVLGTTGGGRDRARGRVLGELAGRFASVVIATDEDPYDDDPRELVARVSSGAQAAGKIIGRNLFTELDRREAIRRAVCEARPQDLVLITGKGCEQAIVRAGGRKIPWDDRRITAEAIATVLGDPAP